VALGGKNKRSVEFLNKGSFKRVSRENKQQRENIVPSGERIVKGAKTTLTRPRKNWEKKRRRVNGRKAVKFLTKKERLAMVVGVLLEAPCGGISFA